MTPADLDLELIKQEWQQHTGEDFNNPKRETALLIMALVAKIEALTPPAAADPAPIPAEPTPEPPAAA